MSSKSNEKMEENIESKTDEKNSKQEVVFDIPGLDPIQQKDDNQTTSQTVDEISEDEVHSLTKNVDTENSGEKVLDEMDSASSVKDANNSIPSNCDGFDEDSSNKFEELESKISDILSNISKEQNPQEEVNDDTSGNKVDKEKPSEERLEDLEDASLDGANDGDELGLLAETEGRERHSSDPEDEEDEEDADADIEMEEEHLESDAESETNMEDEDYSNVDDEEYHPRSEEDEATDHIIEEAIGKRYRKKRKTKSSLPVDADSNGANESQKGFQSDTEFIESVDTTCDTAQSTDFTNICENSLSEIDKPALSIFEVTSLAAKSSNEMIDSTEIEKSDDVSESLKTDKKKIEDFDLFLQPSTESPKSVKENETTLEDKTKEKETKQVDEDEKMIEVLEPSDEKESTDQAVIENVTTDAIDSTEPMDVDEQVDINETEISTNSEKTGSASTDKPADEVPTTQKVIDISESNDTDVKDSKENEVLEKTSLEESTPCDKKEKAEKKGKEEECVTVSKESVGDKAKVEESSQVYLLDSDEENSEAPPKVESTGNNNLTVTISIDVDDISKKNRREKRFKPGDKCVNPVCLESDTLVPCPLFIPSLFRARDISKEPKACKSCLDSGISLMENLSSRFKAGHCLLDAEVPNNQDLVEISDSDSEDESDAKNRLIKGGWRKKGLPKTTADELLNEIEKNYINEVMPDLFCEVWNKYDVNKQIEMCEENLLKKMSALDVECADLEKLINHEQVELDTIRTKLYESFRHPTICRTEIILTDHGNHCEVNSLIPERRSSRIKKQVLVTKPTETAVPENVVNVAPRVSIAEQNADSARSNTVEQNSTPTRGRLPDYTLTVGDTVYAVRQSIFGAWCLAQIVRVMPRGTQLANGTLSQFSLVSVHFVQGGESEQVTKQVTGRQVAYVAPSTVLYPIGTRVIALFQNKLQLKEAFYSGVIAEIPVKSNRFRYLVFFDDGYARYAYHSNILLVCQRSLHAWEDVHPDSRDFIRKYLQGFPNQPMVRVQAGQNIKAEYKGKFIMASVEAVDASLALIKFAENSGVPPNHEEWIYRGSTRLEPLYLELLNADRKSQGRHRASYATTNLNKSKHFPYVEYSRPEQADFDIATDPQMDVSVATAPKNKEEPNKESSGPRAVAKKSTSHREEPSKLKDKDDPPTQQVHADQVKSKVVYYSPKVTIRPKKLVPHLCGADCLNKDAIALRELRTYNPLARPLLSGWQRLIIKYRGKRTIMYHAPCGRRLRNAKELRLYLRLTQSQMSVDLFDFDHWVHCLAEFVPTKCFVSKKDLSHGVEAVPVPCVNYYDHTLPEFSAYSTRRIPTKGVNLNLDEEFLCGCDCTDDCYNRSKCQCWQLTLEGASVIGSQMHRVGYQYKRLLEPVPTGIYECNSRCKCAATCLNRVVQHPLQLKLQVFKTFNRGWGIRALNDVSKGTFICIYAGNLLTDAVANVDGVTEGDEYLAELDYIEVVEKLKENYESDVPEEDQDFDEESEEPSDNEKKDSSKDKKTGPHGESDEEFKPTFKINSDGSRVGTRQLRKKRSDKGKGDKENKKQEKKEEAKIETPKKVEPPKNEEKTTIIDDDSVVPVVDEFITISDDEEKREPSRFAAPDHLEDDNKYTPKHRSVRPFFGKDEACYIMDAKVQGNLGRYLNHSCAPNVFVQNVFVDTHDPRFPWVAFFTLNHVRAGTELTWNYNYDVGSVPGKVIFCRCGAVNCRGRLL